MASTNKKHMIHLYEKLACWLFGALITIETILMFINGNEAKGFMGMKTIVVFAVMYVYQTRSSRPLPAPFTIIIYTFTFIAVGLGTLGGFYQIPHFDDALHLLSGVWIGYGSLIMLNILVGEELASRLPRAFILLYMISFSLAAAGLWELLEFTGDKWFHYNAQGRDHDDTMFDMIDGLIGGFVAALLFLRRTKAE